ncbi:hypothetical protein MSSAC_1573 [Methanosarcina siciliae C2J]|uniref:Uncharacterized protein n=1 Tax=Methanosarcina siciliae C2J TaxID=1434118 RepID=A0A0E3PMH2_9EURY|nr:SIR2 family protein [Methanosarcina siciliae]AKB36163.1 hypothetical protein MSSAC_1573 [Methanosarcina siciliae C2J]
MDKEDQQQKNLINETLRVLESQYGKSSEFNEYFDGEEPLSIPSPQQDVDDYRYDKSRVLFWLDRDAYAEEKTAWENQTIQERHKDAIDLLKNSAQISQFRELVEAVRRQRIVPFIGAGLSKSMNMPLWGEALQTLRAKLPNLIDSNFNVHLENGRYLDAAQILADHDGILTQNFIRTTYSVQEVEGPVTMLPQIARGCIITTNFDRAVEEVFKRESVAFDGYMHGTQHHNFFSRLVKGERCILKLHGDADDPQTYIFTRNQYVDAYGEPFDFCKNLPKALRQIYISNSLLFLGCSLEQDWTLELFKAVKEADQYEIPNHYAILQEPETAAKKQQKESYLLRHSIQPIWYPASKHEYVEKLLRLIIDVKDNKIALPSR